MYRLIYVFLICLACSAHAQSFITEEWKYGICDKGTKEVLQIAVPKGKLMLPTDNRYIDKQALDIYCQQVSLNHKNGKDIWHGPVVRCGEVILIIQGYTIVNYFGKVLEVFMIIVNKSGSEWSEHSAWQVLYSPSVGFYYVNDNYSINGIDDWQYFVLKSKPPIDKGVIDELLKNKYKAGLMLKCE